VLPHVRTEVCALARGRRRKAVVAAHAAEGPASDAAGPGNAAVQAACGAGSAHKVHMVECISEFKRSCDVWPNVGAFYSSKRREQKKTP